MTDHARGLGWLLGGITVAVALALVGIGVVLGAWLL